MQRSTHTHTSKGGWGWGPKTQSFLYLQETILYLQETILYLQETFLYLQDIILYLQDNSRQNLPGFWLLRWRYILAGAQTVAHWKIARQTIAHKKICIFTKLYQRSSKYPATPWGKVGITLPRKYHARYRLSVDCTIPAFYWTINTLVTIFFCYERPSTFLTTVFPRHMKNVH